MDKIDEGNLLTIDSYENVDQMDEVEQTTNGREGRSGVRIHPGEGRVILKRGKKWRPKTPSRREVTSNTGEPTPSRGIQQAETTDATPRSKKSPLHNPLLCTAPTPPVFTVSKGIENSQPLQNTNSYNISGISYPVQSRVLQDVLLEGK